MSDELPTAARVSDPGIRALYRLENRWQAWLDVEAALAKAQQELGIIPQGAAEAIRLGEGISPYPFEWCSLTHTASNPHCAANSSSSMKSLYM